ncbi:GPI biosynthesis protein family Pig-F-domain-containing protein [Daldinia caldariorum]|uniref:GPI biosynthesis protein family Pig-F-domain-containing protein n=1 Tax=Daldinia caldariorum TaxID=326644 RepID=UPI0020083BBD|nr:GPI biosynthesis protein family Pig-F-domain-containing protein [Daldinia caldariorum]KAI1467949.1 GPI biosynthesis protein family Pig-F-domain-containing protein [Daldinia caldariorum]
MPALDTASISSSSSPAHKAKAGAAAASGELSKPKDKDTKDAQTQPIQILASSQAQVVRHLQPALLVSLFLARFRTLVADPVSALSSALPVVVAVQVTYAVVCLPAVGSSAAKPARKPRPGEKKKAGGPESSGPNIAVTTLVALILSALSTLPLHAILVLFGAPFLTHVEHTFLGAAHLSALALFPLFYSRGVSGADWHEVLSASAPLDEPFAGLVGACVGAWLGAVPIPLDWDREWQKWPVTIVAGVYAGYLVGKGLGGTVAFGKRFF